MLDLFFLKNLSQMAQLFAVKYSLEISHLQTLKTSPKTKPRESHCGHPLETFVRGVKWTQKWCSPVCSGGKCDLNQE